MDSSPNFKQNKNYRQLLQDDVSVIEEKAEPPELATNDGGKGQS